MNVVDANVLVYAVNRDAPEHAASRRWLDDALSGGATVGFAWAALLAFRRIVTRGGVLPHPLRVEEAVAVSQAWLAQPAAVLCHPTAHHHTVLAELLTAVGTGGNLVTDAHLAALAIEHRGAVVSFDRDFDRFPGVRCVRPS